MYQPKNVVLHEDELYDKLFWWQEALGLDAWTIEVKTASRSELDDAEGDVEWVLTRRSATIRILDPRYREPDDKPWDMEYVLVHELLHVLFAYWDDWTRDDKRPLHPVLDAACIEQPIDALARLLIDLRRITLEK